MGEEIEFFDIPVLKGFEISKCGIVREKINKKILPQCLRMPIGYYYISINRPNQGFNNYAESIHRLLCFTFKPNPENKKCVNHINAIRTDNRLENLEWATYSENNHHAFVVGNKCHKGSLNVMAREIIDLETGFIFDCIKDASSALNIKYTALRCALSKTNSYLYLKNRFKYI